MTGKIRVSIVATALDGHKTENKTVLNMVSRIQNRNSGYSENLFSRNPVVENNTFGSIDGATALKLDESYQLKEEEINNSINSFYSSICDGCQKHSEWHVYWIGIEDYSLLKNCIEYAISKPKSVI